MLMGRRQKLLAALCGAFLASLSACAAQQQEKASIVGNENGLPKVGEPFRDCAECPEMVVVPSGTFMMGAPESEAGSYDRERPVHSVSVPSFAVGVYEVTVSEFRHFVDETGHSTGHSCGTFEEDGFKVRADRSWLDPGYQQGEVHPVTCVSWRDARAYVDWLSEKTGERYRLPSESEWEYAARAGTERPRFWEDAESGQCRHANGGDESLPQHLTGGSSLVASCSDGHAYPAPVGSYAANGWGLRDVLGNVWEWTEDCSNESYNGAPANGTAWLEGNCGVRVLWGAAFDADTEHLRFAVRNRLNSGARHFFTGIRVARTLEPSDAARGAPTRAARRQEEASIGDDGSGPPTAGDSFQDCPECPEMVVIPAGRFRMGGSVGGGGDDQQPLREMRIQQPFALGKYELTVGEFRQFVEAADYRTYAERDPEDGCYTLEMPVANGWDWSRWRSWWHLAYEVTDAQPVVCVNVKDVQAYISWLSERTGAIYRLPSEAEWEYAARAGSETIYHFGNDDALLCDYGNVQDETDFPSGSSWADAVECSAGAVFPVPVGSYAPNAWGLYDTIGNVWEWTADCWNADYPLGAPDDGSADEQGDCGSRIVRGGSWSNAPLNLGSAYRNGAAARSRGDTTGFRVARTLVP